MNVVKLISNFIGRHPDAWLYIIAIAFLLFAVSLFPAACQVTP